MKEMSGLKNNTVRKVTEEDRFKLLREYSPENFQIEIVNTDSGMSFIRNLRDITFWEDLVILTWHEEAPEISEDSFEATDIIAARAARNEANFQKNILSRLTKLQDGINILRAKD
jgi:hypothetical protein